MRTAACILSTRSPGFCTFNGYTLYRSIRTLGPGDNALFPSSIPFTARCRYAGALGERGSGRCWRRMRVPDIGPRVVTRGGADGRVLSCSGQCGLVMCNGSGPRRGSSRDVAPFGDHFRCHDGGDGVVQRSHRSSVSLFAPRRLPFQRGPHVVRSAVTASGPFPGRASCPVRGVSELTRWGRSACI